jgi:hypothetical protein
VVPAGTIVLAAGTPFTIGIEKGDPLHTDATRLKMTGVGFSITACGLPTTEAMGKLLPQASNIPLAE